MPEIVGAFLAGGALGALATVIVGYFKFHADREQLADLKDQRRELRRAERRRAYEEWLTVETHLASLTFGVRTDENLSPQYIQDVRDALAEKAHAVVLIATDEVRDAAQLLLDAWHARADRAELAYRRTALLDAMRQDVVDLVSRASCSQP
jgi:hypothetical protein